MKFLLVVFCISISAIAQSLTVGLNQSYLIMDNGKALTVRSYVPAPSQNLVPLFMIEDHFFDTTQIEVFKSSYIIDNDDNIFTVTADGFMYKLENFKLDSKIKYYGETFFITKKGSVYVIDSQGYIIKTSYKDLKEKIKPEVLGANYIITSKNKVIMINTMTAKLHFLKDEIEVEDIKKHSNNFLTTKKGYVYTFGFMQNADFSYKPIVSKLKAPYVKRNIIMGGNFFFDYLNNLHTVSFNGLYDGGIANRKLKVNLSLDNTDRSTMTPAKLGSNYFIYRDGSVYHVDSYGLFGQLTTIDFRLGQTTK